MGFKSFATFVGRIFLIFLAAVGLGGFTSLSAEDMHVAGLMPTISQTGEIHDTFDYNIFLYTIVDTFSKNIGGQNYPARNLQIYFEPSVIWRFREGFSLAASYAFQRDEPFQPQYINEHRIWEQITYNHALWGGRLNHRVRFEERFIENRDTETYPLSTRLRYQIAFQKPIIGSQLETAALFLSCYEETFFSTSGSRNALFSENWLYLGVGHVLDKRIQLEAGYLLQAAVSNADGDIRYLHLLNFQIRTNF